MGLSGFSRLLSPVLHFFASPDHHNGCRTNAGTWAASPAAMRAAVAEPACRSRIFPGIFAGKRVQSLPCQQRCREAPAPARFHPAPFLEEARTVRQRFVILSLLLACAPLLPAVDTQAACTAGNCQNGRGVLTGKKYGQAQRSLHRRAQR